MFKFDSEIEWILGQPNFMCASTAEALRRSGMEIKRHAESEQAAVIYWMLEMYEIHGAQWRERASEFLMQVNRKK